MKKIVLFVLPFLLFSNVNAEEINMTDLTDLKNKTAQLKTSKQSEDNNLKTYPVGSIYITTSEKTATEVHNKLGGTWEAYAPGRKLIGIGSNGTTNYTYNATGGSSTKTISVANMPSHSHSLTATGSVTSTFTGTAVTSSAAGGHNHTIPWHSSGSEASGYGLDGSQGFGNRLIVDGGSMTSSGGGGHTHSLTATGSVTSTFKGTSANTSYTGSGTAFSIQNPYVTVYMWKKTAD